MRCGSLDKSSRSSGLGGAPLSFRCSCLRELQVRRPAAGKLDQPWMTGPSVVTTWWGAGGAWSPCDVAAPSLVTWRVRGTGCALLAGTDDSLRIWCGSCCMACCWRVAAACSASVGGIEMAALIALMRGNLGMPLPAAAAADAPEPLVEPGGAAAAAVRSGSCSKQSSTAWPISVAKGEGLSRETGATSTASGTVSGVVPELLASCWTLLLLTSACLPAAVGCLLQQVLDVQGRLQLLLPLPSWLCLQLLRLPRS